MPAVSMQSGCSSKSCRVLLPRFQALSVHRSVLGSVCQSRAVESFQARCIDAGKIPRCFCGQLGQASRNFAVARLRRKTDVDDCAADHDSISEESPRVDAGQENGVGIPSTGPGTVEDGQDGVSSSESNGSQQPKGLPWLFVCARRTMTFFAIVVNRCWKALRRISRLSILVAAVGSFLLGLLVLAVKPPPEIFYSDFVTLVDKGAVWSAQFEEDSDRIYITLRPEVVERIIAERVTDVTVAAARESKKESKKTQTQSPTGQVTQAGAEKLGRLARYPTKLIVRNIPGNVALATQLKAAGVRFGVVGAPAQRALGKAVGYMAVLWVPLIPLFWFFRRSLSARDGSKKSKTAESSAPSVKFSDIAGLDSAKEELLEVVQLLKSPEKYTKLNAKTPSGVLLCGPTGTGKTLLARAVAGEAEVPFFTASASEFVEMFVGRGAARIRDLFKDARKNVPCVVFVDEIDAVGGRRGYSYNDERDQTLNQLLVELDGFEGNPGIVLLAATNRPETLDPALLRPGRLTRKVLVPLPDLAGRCAILAVHLRKVPMRTEAEKQAASESIARLTSKFSGADLANTVNEAALLAARDGRDFVQFKDLLQGVQRTNLPVNAKESGRGLGKLFLEGTEWLNKLWGEAVLETQQRPKPEPGA